MCDEEMTGTGPAYGPSARARAASLTEKGEENVGRDDHGPAFPTPENALRAAQTSGLFPDPLANAGKPPAVVDALAVLGEEDFRCQAYGNGKLARCERCGTQWNIAEGEKAPPCADHPVAGWIHAVASPGPKRTETEREPFVIQSGRGEKWGDPPSGGTSGKPGPEIYHGPFKPQVQEREPFAIQSGPYGNEKRNQVSRPKSEGGGLRFSLGKCKLDLVPPEWVWALGMVLTRGAIKYAVRNWERGMKWSEVAGPMFRHAFKFICGERYDPETGCHHMAMVAWNALVLMTYDIREIGDNDLVGEMPWLDLVATDMGPELQAVFERRMAEAAARK